MLHRWKPKYSWLASSLKDDGSSWMASAHVTKIVSYTQFLLARQFSSCWLLRGIPFVIASLRNRVLSRGAYSADGVRARARACVCVCVCMYPVPGPGSRVIRAHLRVRGLDSRPPTPSGTPCPRAPASQRRGGLPSPRRRIRRPRHRRAAAPRPRSAGRPVRVAVRTASRGRG